MYIIFGWENKLLIIVFLVTNFAINFYPFFYKFTLLLVLVSFRESWIKIIVLSTPISYFSNNLIAHERRLPWSVSLKL